jgi:hypothetical protein
MCEWSGSGVECESTEESAVEAWSSVCGMRSDVLVDSISSFLDDEYERRASPFKDWEEPSGVPSCLSSGLLRVEVFCLLEDKDAASSIIFFYCCLDSWTVLLSPIIVLATVVLLYIPFALSSDRLIFPCIFWNFGIFWVWSPRPNVWCVNINIYRESILYS